MTKIKCASDICFNNTSGECKAKEIEIEGNKLDPKCMSVVWNPDEIEIILDEM